MKRLLVLLLFGVAAVLVAGCGVAADQTVGLEGDDTSEMRYEGNGTGSLGVGEVLVGVSIDAGDPDEVAARIAAKYDGQIVGSIREVREYQIKFPVDTDEETATIRESISEDIDVSLVF
jgi:hypothetical protein